MATQPLKGRRALVTGASRGIGEAVARGLAGRGAELLVVARDKARLDKLATELSAEGTHVDVICADMADDGSVERLVKTVRQVTNHLDIVVNNAGMLPAAQRMEDISRTQWNRVLDVNLNSPWYLACRAKELMTSNGGVIVNIASTAAFFPSAGLAPYNVSKAGLVMLTKVCALEWAKANVRVLAVAPGKVSTDMVAPILDWTRSKSLEVNPVGRVASPVEVANLVAYLVSDDATYMTGTVVAIDGGELLTFGR